MRMRWTATSSTRLAAGTLALLLGTSAGGLPAQHRDSDGKTLILERQGSLAFGGTVITGDDGDTFHGDHGYAEFQIPPNARTYPLVMWHGAGQSGWSYQSTPDGREGFQSIFVRRGFGVYIIDQPRQGRAGRSTKGSEARPDAVPGESGTFMTFRLGVWVPPGPPEFFSNVQFPRDPESLEQYFRQGTLHGTGGARDDWTGIGEAHEVVTDAVAKLVDQIGPAVLITHSGSGNQGWKVAMKSKNVRAIVAYEPTTYVFPEGEVPPTGPFHPSVPVPFEDFLKLTKIPIQIVFGDNIPTEPTGIVNLDRWTEHLTDAKTFVDAVNTHGGQAEVLHLPTIGVFGNTHFPFSDLNNVQIANLLSHWLKTKGLDERRKGKPRSQ
jgi:hypothetical protein